MKYTGTLNKRITRRRIGLLGGDDAVQAESNRINAEMVEKLPALFDAHGIEYGNWVRLALALAREHVPGFAVINPPGRPTEWGLALKAEFRLDVDAIATAKGLTVIEAIKLAIRLDAWAIKTKPMDLRALEKHYYTADLRFVEIVKKARAYESIVGTN